MIRVDCKSANFLRAFSLSFRRRKSRSFGFKAPASLLKKYLPQRLQNTTWKKRKVWLSQMTLLRQRTDPLNFTLLSWPLWFQLKISKAKLDSWKLNQHPKYEKGRRKIRQQILADFFQHHSMRKHAGAKIHIFYPKIHVLKIPIFTKFMFL